MGFRDWILPRSEAPEQFIFWSGVFAISATLRRRVYIPERILGGWSCTPHMYIMFVSPPGLRKTVTARKAGEILSQINLHEGPTITTVTALTDEILKADESAVYLTVEEFGDIILKGGKEMFEFLTSMFDAKLNFTQSTMLRGKEFASKPVINMLAGTTPRWISENMPAAVIGGGFASRVIFIYEDKIRKRQMYYKHIVDMKEVNEIEKNLVHDLEIISKIEGELDLTDEAIEKGEEWYQRLSQSNSNEKLNLYLARKHVHVHKLAMVLHFSRSDDMILGWEDLEAAIKIMEATEKSLPKVFHGVGKNVYTFDTKAIVEYVTLNPGVSEKDLLRMFESVATPVALNELISGCLQMGFIKSEYSKEAGRTFSLGD